MPYTGRQFDLWLVLTAAVLAAVWFVWQFERGGFSQPAVPPQAEQNAVSRKALALLEQARLTQGDLNQSDLKREALAQGRQAAEVLRREADFVIHDATFFGRSAAGKNWRVAAEEAARPAGEKLVYLQQLEATVESPNEQNNKHSSKQNVQKDVALKAASGLLDDEKDLLLLKDGFSGTVHGYKTSGREASYQLKHQQAEGRVLDVLGEALRLEAQQFDTDLETQQARFTEGVRLRVSFNNTGGGLELGRREQ